MSAQPQGGPTPQDIMRYASDGLPLACDLIAHGIPVVVCRPNPAWTPGSGTTDVLPPKGWSTITALQAAERLNDYRPGVDILAMVAGHGVDVVDVDTKVGGTLANLPGFRHFGRIRTPSGGEHLYVRSTGLGKLSPLTTSAGHVGDYAGGTTAGGGRMLVYLPGSARPRYAGERYVVVERPDLDALVEHEPDEDLVAALLACGATRDGAPGRPAATHAALAWFLAEYELAQPTCHYGRQAVGRLLAEADASVPGDPKFGRHAWAVRAATRVFELMRAGCASTGDLEAVHAKLRQIKPEGGTDWSGVMAWALANGDGTVGCGVHGEKPQESPQGGAGAAPGATLDLDATRTTPQTVTAPRGDVLDLDAPFAPTAATTPEQDGDGGSDDDGDPPLWVDVAKVLAGGTEPLRPDICRRTDGVGLFYRGKVNVLFGDPECGKTWIAYAAVVEALTGGGRALIIDVDHNGAADILARLLALGVPEHILVDPDRFRLSEPDDAASLIMAAREGAAWGPDVAVVDSIGEALPILGLKSESPDDYTRGHRMILTVMARANTAVIAVDHLAKAADSREQGATGTAAKRRAVSGASIRVTLKEPFRPGGTGRAVLKVHKDRPGGLRAASAAGGREQIAGDFVLTSSHHGQAAWLIDPADGSPTPFRPTTLMERISRFLEASEGPQSLRAIRDAVQGKNTAMAEAAAALVAEGYVERSNGPRGALMHTLVQPFSILSDAERRAADRVGMSDSSRFEGRGPVAPPAPAPEPNGPHRPPQNYADEQTVKSQVKAGKLEETDDWFPLAPSGPPDQPGDRSLAPPFIKGGPVPDPDTREDLKTTLQTPPRRPNVPPPGFVTRPMSGGTRWVNLTTGEVLDPAETDDHGTAD